MHVKASGKVSSQFEMFLNPSYENGFGFIPFGEERCSRVCHDPVLQRRSVKRHALAAFSHLDKISQHMEFFRIVVFAFTLFHWKGVEFALSLSSFPFSCSSV